MTDPNEGKSGDAHDTRADWSKARPEVIPRPTFFPAALAFGITLFLWGFVSSPVVLAAGGVVMVTGLVGWIGEMRHEQ